MYCIIVASTIQCSTRTKTDPLSLALEGDAHPVRSKNWHTGHYVSSYVSASAIIW